MRPKTVAAFALGLAFGVVCLGLALWAAGAIVAAPPPWKKIVVPITAAAPPAPQTAPLGETMADLGKIRLPAPPEAEPFAFPEATPSPAPEAGNARDVEGRRAPPAPQGTGESAVVRPDFVGPIPPAKQPGFIGPLAPPVGPLPDSPTRALGSHPPVESREKIPAGQGEANRIATDNTLPHLSLPLPGIDPKKINDTFSDPRGGHSHEALDMMAPRGTPVLAVAEGNVAKLFLSKDGGLTVYQFDNTRTWCFYYAHLDRYAAGLQDGTLLRKGQILGYVGSTGNASPSAPHLHFALFKLGPEKKWWEGTAIDPAQLFR